MNALPSGTILIGKSYQYTILKVLGQGTFGITYLALVKMTGALGSIDIKVAIKEFFMQDINGRSGTSVTSWSKGGVYDDYKKKFAREALNLSKLQHPNIIKVVESFESNNTVYYVMEYIEGGNLDDYILKEKGLKEDAAVRLIRQIGGALSYMHGQKMLHLDLKPKNVMLRKDGDAVLIDFGLSKQYNAKGEPESSTRVGQGTPGYAPLEQTSYRDGKGFPVTMDVYALGATMFKMLTAVRPPEASEILNEGFPLYELQAHKVSDSVCASVAKAMAPLKKDRYPSVRAFINSLKEDPTLIDMDTTSDLDVDNPVIQRLLDNMVYVEGGTYTMGATPEQGRDAYDDESPAHKVTLSSFCIGRYEVTQEEWEALMGNNPSTFKGKKHPVEGVSWYDCQEFISKLNAMTGKTFRLPTEAEWEYAARGGQKSRGFKYAGGNTADDVLWYGANSKGTTHDVDSKQPNELSLYNMSGNVLEWCQDWYGNYGSAFQTNPQGPTSGSTRVLRGGSRGGTVVSCRVSYRYCSHPSCRHDYGFRLAQ